MTTIAHISDLHFGAEDPVVAEALREELTARSPQLTVISGDLTQRARSAQFEAARDYLRQLPQPQLVVPGNHDVPLYDVARRFLAPFGRYRRFISPEVCPQFCSDSLLVVGINTARSLTWKNGRVSAEQMERLRRQLTGSAATFRVLVTHHPFIPPALPGEAKIELVGRAAQTLDLLDEHQVDLLLAGHLHQGYSGLTQPYYPKARRGIVAAQAGTAISRRVRGQANAYNWITLAEDRITIEVNSWKAPRFRSAPPLHYGRVGNSWLPLFETLAT